MRSSPEITLPVRLDRSGTDPLPAQLAGRLRELVTADVLAPGDTLPSTRALAVHLGVSRGTVLAAYDQLLAEGYLSAAAGRSTVVNPQLRRVHPHPPRAHRPLPPEPTPAYDLRPGRPWAEEVTGPAWRTAWRQASAAPVGGPVPVLGLPALRSAWSEHLRRMRAVVRDPAQIAVTGGGREGFALVLLARAGARPLRVAVEEPGYPSLRRVPARFGATVVPLPVDEHGLRVADLPGGRAAPDVLLVTPSHQYPLGGSLPVDRRQALLEWARRNHVLIVEDDYDSELRYTSQPLPALAALDDPVEGNVALLGTLSKTLTPALGMGFLALPATLVPAVAAARHDLGQPVGAVAQQAIAHYLAAGALRLHTQRMRNRYRRRRAQVTAALADTPGVRVYPMDGGLHAVVQTRRPEAEVVAALAAAGVLVSPLSEYWSGAGQRQGIVFGFGALTERELAEAMSLVAPEVGLNRL
ncbi:HTH-type transcriptional regulatory protein GabR [Propionicimonas sp. T2.31MG-18]|uniref:MocR-like pyridoxine biosynthesis transcription factor PdxR n=1 Tax=Propionicimonas sp. T2.31MG-18 TaxID=3157620 RepID=UPI0035E6D237